MVKTSGETPRLSGIRRLNQARPLDVRVDANKLPNAIRDGKTWVAVTSIEDQWRVDDEWWREKPVQRSFYQAVLQDGRKLTFYLDELALSWHLSRV